MRNLDASAFTPLAEGNLLCGMRNVLIISISVSLLLFGAGCATRAPLACPEAPAAGRTAKVFFATDRRQLPSGGELRFGRERTDPPGLHLGWERVALGPGHRLGKVDAAIAITPAHEQNESAEGPRPNALRRTDAEIAAFVETRLRPAIRSAPPLRAGRPRQVLVFIHGYNTTFDEAVRKTAQLAGDLELVTCGGEMRGVSVAYSWPAQGTLLSYLADEENAEWTQQRLAPFLQALARVCRQERAELNLVAHSMGARALVRSLADLANAGEPHRREKLADHVILLAPDIGRGLFDQYVERFLPLVGHLTIYVSAKDRALGLSSLLHGGHQRLGLLESTVLAALQITGFGRGDHRELGYIAEQGGAPGKIDMIDVSGSFASQLGHSYDDPAFVADLRELLSHDTPAGSGGRGNLQRRELGPSPFRNVKHLRYFRLKTGAL